MSCKSHLALDPHIILISLQTGGVGPLLGWRWPIVYDAGPTSAQQRAEASCLLGYQQVSNCHLYNVHRICDGIQHYIIFMIFFNCGPKRHHSVRGSYLPLCRGADTTFLISDDPQVIPVHLSVLKVAHTQSTPRYIIIFNSFGYVFMTSLCHPIMS